MFDLKTSTKEVKVIGLKMAAVEGDGLERRVSVPHEETPTSPTVLPWDRFSNWIHCACVVTFDLELGQAMEV